MKIEIRRPNQSDVELLNQLFITTINEVFDREGLDMPELRQEEIKEKEAFLLEDLESGGKSRYFLIACVEGVIAGTAALGPSNLL